jgi:amidase
MTRRLPKEGNLKYALSATDVPVDTIAPGEIVQVECEINCNGGLITSTESKLSEDSLKFPYVNPATGPFAVTGARRGQALAVTIHQMELDDVGFTALLPGIGMFPDWVRKKEFGIHTRAMEVPMDLSIGMRNVNCQSSQWSGLLAWPRFMAGC